MVYGFYSFKLVEISFVPRTWYRVMNVSMYLQKQNKNNLPGVSTPASWSPLWFLFSGRGWFSASSIGPWKRHTEESNLVLSSVPALLPHLRKPVLGEACVYYSSDCWFWLFVWKRKYIIVVIVLFLMLGNVSYSKADLLLLQVSWLCFDWFWTLYFSSLLYF